MSAIGAASMLAALTEPWSAVTIALIACLVPWAMKTAFGARRGTNAKEVRQPRKPKGDPGRAVFVNASPCMPAGEVIYNNAPEPLVFDSGVCSGAFICLHKPTDDEEAMASGDYPYADHMHGRRRLWEFRIQLCFRQKVDGEIFFGAEQDRYYPIGRAQRCVGDSVIGMLRRAATGMYQSHGDDPEATQGEKERPGIVFPLWVMDQLIISEPGEAPPSLTDPDFAQLGRTKSSNRPAMRQAISNLDFKEGVTYTFGFWCISQFVDAIGWCSRAPRRGLLPEVGLRELGTHPPAFITMYALKPREDWANDPSTSDRRHLDSRKTYLFRVALWSSKMPPEQRRLQELTDRVQVKGLRPRVGLSAEEAERARRRQAARCCCGLDL